jgi:hypothetical protein
LAASDVLRLLADHVKEDGDFIPRESHQSSRWHATVGGHDFELLCTGPKFLDTRAGTGGGGAIDLAMHLLHIGFKQATQLLRTKGI